jgi:hypothetical protein
MTGIAYRDGVMAADSACYAGDIYQGDVTKIARSRYGALAGAAGDTVLCDEFRRLFAASTTDIDWQDWRPTIVGNARFGAIVVLPNGEIRQLDESGWHPVNAPFYTEGSGSTLMIGAMAAGASAEEAVAIAIRYDAHCGGDVQVERLATQATDFASEARRAGCAVLSGFSGVTVR